MFSYFFPLPLNLFYEKCHEDAVNVPFTECFDVYFLFYDTTGKLNTNSSDI